MPDEPFDLDLRLERQCGQRTNDATLLKQVEEIARRAFSAGRGRNWEYHVTLSEDSGERSEGFYLFRARITGKRTKGKPAPINLQQICFWAEKAGKTGTAFQKYPWRIVAGNEAYLGAIQADESDHVKDYADVGTTLGHHFDHLYGRDHQIKIIHSAITAAVRSDFNHRFHVVMHGPPGCHARGTEILMANGTTKKVECICVGEKLRGTDGPRDVLELVRGVDTMYRIRAFTGDEFEVNENHLLTVVDTESCLIDDLPVKSMYYGMTDDKLKALRLIKYNKISNKSGMDEVELTRFTITRLCKGEYIGFRVDKDHRYLMGNKILTHNCAKTDILESFGNMLGVRGVNYMVFDATSTTQAGAQKFLMEEAEVIPPVLIIEEIEKAEENSLRWLLGILDQRAIIQKVNARVGHQARNVKMLCLATVNDMPRFQSVMYGALASRFSHEIYCPRPDRKILKKILEREVNKINGKVEWIEPALRYCVDERNINDPRKVIPICLCGGDDLLTGKYQKSLDATRPKKPTTRQNGG